MVRTVVAFESEKDQEAIAGVLEKSGITVRFRCRTGLETIRAVKQMGGGIVVAGYKFPDMTTENLAWQLKDDGVTVLMVANPPRPPPPPPAPPPPPPPHFRQEELVVAVKILFHLDQQRFKPSAARRTDHEKLTIVDVK